MKFIRIALPLLCCAILGAGHAALLQRRVASDEGVFAERLAGVRGCLSLHAGEEMEVQAIKQRYGTDSFLVARPAGSPKLVAKAALHATYEALFRGTGCTEAADEASAAWFVDVGTDDDEVLALASSLGCGVSVLDPEVKDVRAVDMTRCMNEEPNRPFVIFQVTATNVTNPETLANLTRAAHFLETPYTTAPVFTESNSSSLALKKQASMLGIGKPTMLNRVWREKKLKADRAVQKKKDEMAAQKKKDEAAQKQKDEAAAKKKKEIEKLKATPPAPMQKGVMLDTLFTSPNASLQESIEVATASGRKIAVNKISVLKVTPRSENAATLKALEGARGLIKSGRVQCLVTEMNFDVNHTESFLNYVGELEHLGFKLAHLGSLDYSELEVTDQGQYEVFSTDLKQLQELFDTYKRIRSFDERSGFRVYSGSLSLDRKGHYFDYTDLIFACKNSFPERLSVLEKGKIRFRNGVWWLEKQ